MATTPRETAVSYFEALGRHDLDAAVALLHDDIVEEITGVGVMRGPAEVRKFFEGLIGAVPDLEVIVDGTTAEDDRVVVQWRFRGGFTGGPLYNGVQATGGDFEIRGCDVLEIRDGKVARNSAYQDGMETARTLGMMPPQDSAAEKAMIAAFNTATKVRQAVRDRFSG